MMLALHVLFWLVVGHAVADYPWQGDFLSRAKCPQSGFHGIDWQIALAMHAIIHAGMVALVFVLAARLSESRAIAVGVIEFIWHVYIDLMKCNGRTSFRTDQLLHMVCKVCYLVFLL